MVGRISLATDSQKARDGNVPDMIVLVKSTNRLILLFGQLNLLEVGFDSLFLDRLGDYGVATVSTPGNENLCGGGFLFFSNFDDGGVICEFGPPYHCQIGKHRYVIADENIQLFPRGL